MTARLGYCDCETPVMDIDHDAGCRRCGLPVDFTPNDSVCQWFAGCGRPATGTTPHPILGDVPTCDRCSEFAAS
jgi:hypothetical protein